MNLAPSLRNNYKLLLLVALVLTQLAINYYLVSAANSQGILTGEESAMNFRDMFFTTERLQHNGYATSFTSYGFYAVCFKLFPSPDSFYGRWCKATVMALFSACVAVYGYRRLKLTPFGAGIAGTLVGIMPTMAAFSWLATDQGLEALWGISSLLLVGTGAGSAIALSGLVAGLGSHQAAGLVFLPVLLLELYFYWNESRGWKRLRWVVGALAMLALGLLMPMIWWTNHVRGFFGGGELVWQLAPLIERNGKLLFNELFIAGKSYYYFSDFPALSNPLLVAALVFGMILAVVGWRIWWPVLMASAGILAVVLVAGGVPGLRRFVIFFPMAALFIGGFCDYAKSGLFGKFPSKIATALTVAMILALLLWPAWQVRALAGKYKSGEIALPADFEFTLVPGWKMAYTVDFLLDNPESLKRNRHLLNYDRLMAMLFLLGEKNGKGVSRFVDRNFLLDDWKTKWPELRKLRPSTRL